MFWGLTLPESQLWERELTCQLTCGTAVLVALARIAVILDVNCHPQVLSHSHGSRHCPQHHPLTISGSGDLTQLVVGNRVFLGPLWPPNLREQRQSQGPNTDRVYTCRRWCLSSKSAQELLPL